MKKQSEYTELEKQLFDGWGNIKRYIGSDKIDLFKEGQMATTTFPNGYGHGPRTHNESIALNTIDRPSVKMDLRIRKLVPLETMKLMGFERKDDGNPLEGFLEDGGHLRKIAGGQDAEGQRDAQQDENGLEHIPERNDQGGNLMGDGRHLQVQAAPQPEIERRHDDGESGGNGRQADGQFYVRLAERGHEIGDVSSRTGCDQDHSQAHHGGNPPSEEYGQQEGHGRQEDQLAEHAEKDGFRFLEDVDEDAGTDAQGYAEHDESKDDIDGIHPTGIQVDLDFVDGRCGFRGHGGLGF